MEIDVFAYLRIHAQTQLLDLGKRLKQAGHTFTPVIQNGYVTAIENPQITIYCALTFKSIYITDGFLYKYMMWTSDQMYPLGAFREDLVKEIVKHIVNQ